MKNKLSDLNNHLFAQLERLGDESLTDDEITKEIGRAHAITTVASQVISNARLVMEAHLKLSDLPNITEKPKMLT